MVVLIIAILIAVLLPTFVGATTRAKDRAMQSSLRNAVTTAKGFYTSQTDYTGATPAALTAEVGAGSLNFVNGATAPTGQNTVSAYPASASYIVLGGLSKSGTASTSPTTSRPGTTLYAKLGGAGGCAASGAPLPGDPAWKSTW